MSPFSLGPAEGRRRTMMVGATVASILVLGISARVLMARVKCPECGEKTERGQTTCKHYGAELRKSD
jgi:hypothetical protein